MPKGLDVVPEEELPREVVSVDVHQEALGRSRISLEAVVGAGAVAQPQLLEGQQDVPGRVALQRRAPAGAAGVSAGAGGALPQGRQVVQDLDLAAACGADEGRGVKHPGDRGDRGDCAPELDWPQRVDSALAIREVAYAGRGSKCAAKVDGLDWYLPSAHTRDYQTRIMNNITFTHTHHHRHHHHHHHHHHMYVF